LVTVQDQDQRIKVREDNILEVVVKDSG
jgi:hypothetical protein